MWVRGVPRASTAPADFAHPERTYWFTDWTLVAFLRLDHDTDGRVSRDEWHFDPEGFRRVDHDRDGSLTRGEFLDADASEDDDRDDSFENLDADGDGRLSRSEWHGTRSRFDALDEDHNGVLTREEVAGPEEPAPDLFTSVDVNRNGSLEWSEWHWSRASFDARDPNRDGRITRDEIDPSDSTIVAQGQAHRDGYERGLADGRMAGQRDRERGIEWNLEGREELVRADAGYVGELEHPNRLSDRLSRWVPARVPRRLLADLRDEPEADVRQPTSESDLRPPTSDPDLRPRPPTSDLRPPTSDIETAHAPLFRRPARLRNPYSIPTSS